MRTKSPNDQPKKAQSAQAAEKAAAAKTPEPKRGSKDPASGITPEEYERRRKAKGEAPPKTDHDLLEEIQDTYRKIAKVEGEISDLKATTKARREKLGTLNRELHSMLTGQKAFAFGKVGEVEKLETTADWFEVREVGTNRHVSNHKIGDPHLDDFRKRPRDFVVRPLKDAPPEAGKPAVKTAMRPIEGKAVGATTSAAGK